MCVNYNRPLHVHSDNTGVTRHRTTYNHPKHNYYGKYYFGVILNSDFNSCYSLKPGHLGLWYQLWGAARAKHAQPSIKRKTTLLLCSCLAATPVLQTTGGFSSECTMRDKSADPVRRRGLSQAQAKSCQTPKKHLETEWPGEALCVSLHSHTLPSRNA